MKAYSQDLRERALRAVDDDYPRAEIVQMFGISLSTLKRYVKQRLCCKKIWKESDRREIPPSCSA